MNLIISQHKKYQRRDPAVISQRTLMIVTETYSKIVIYSKEMCNVRGSITFTTISKWGYQGHVQ